MEGRSQMGEKTEASTPEAEPRNWDHGRKGGLLIWRCVNVMMMLFFIMASGVQFNDPDPWLWVPLYGTASLLTACVAFRPEITEHKWWKCIYWIHALFCLAMFLYVLVELFIALGNPEADGGLNPLTYEEGRELAGVLITVVWLFTCKQSPTISSKESDASTQSLMTFTIIFGLLPLFLWGLCCLDVFKSYLELCRGMMVD